MIFSASTHCNAIFHLLCNKKTFQLNSTRPTNVNQTPMEAQSFSALLNREKGKIGWKYIHGEITNPFPGFYDFLCFFESSPFFRYQWGWNMAKFKNIFSIFVHNACFIKQSIRKHKLRVLSAFSSGFYDCHCELANPRTKRVWKYVRLKDCIKTEEFSKNLIKELSKHQLKSIRVVRI